MAPETYLVGAAPCSEAGFGFPYEDLSGKRLSTGDGLYDIQAIAFSQRLRDITGARHKLAVERNCKRCPGSERGKRVGQHSALGQIERLLIDKDFHTWGLYVRHIHILDTSNTFVTSEAVDSKAGHAAVARQASKRSASNACTT
jgi:hypothetical protein